MSDPVKCPGLGDGCENMTAPVELYPADANGPAVTWRRLSDEDGLRRTWICRAADLRVRHICYETVLRDGRKFGFELVDGQLVEAKRV